LPKQEQTVLTHYLSVALRNLRASPLASAMNVATLALGIACFMIAYAFGLFWSTAERQFTKSDRIAVLTMSLAFKGNQFSFEGEPWTPGVAAKYLKEDFPALELVSRAAGLGDKTMIASGERALRAPAVAVDAEFLDLFELPFVAGDSRNALRNPRSVVLKKDFAAQLFGVEPPLGQHVLIGNLVDATVTGVIDAIPEPSHMGQSKTASLKFDLLTSYDVLETIETSRRSPNAPPPKENWTEEKAITYALLPADGSLTLDSLRAQLPEFTKRHVPAELSGFAQVKHGAVNVRELFSNAANSEMFLDNVGVTVPSMLLVLGALVLGVACVNYANLATARAARRTREVGLRKALGAQRGQVTTQSLVEAGLLTAIALAVAVAIVVAAMPLLRRLVAADLGAILFAGARFWLFLAAMVVVVTLAAGAYPALVLATVRPVSALRASRAQLGSKWLATLMIGSQFAVASFLLIVVTIAVLQNEHLVRTGLGLRSDPLVMIENQTAITKVDSATLRAELARIPQTKGVTEMAAAPWVNLSGTLMSTTPTQGAPTRLVTTQGVGFDFFPVFDIPLIAGRVFSREHGDQPRDPRRDGPPDPSNPRPIVVDRGFVAELGFASPDAAVDQLVYAPGSDPPRPSQIVGVVENHSFTFFGMMKTTATMYDLMPQLDYQVVRISRDDVAGGLAAIDRTWKQLAPNVAVSRRFVDDYFNDVYEFYLLLSRVLTGLALLAFAISLTGLFGMATLIAGRRMREVGVRKAHGASGARMVAMLLASFSRPVLVANVIVWPLAYIAARKYLETFQAPIALTPLPFALSLAITLAIACLAVGSQTLRAARTRPAEVLRYE
jgi:putative ABC transport system permease protein